MKIAVVGAGTIGLSWTTLMLAKGHTVRVTDPRPDLAEAVRDAVHEFVPTVPGFAGEAEELLSRLEIAGSVEEAVGGVHAVQENGPERLEFKQELFAAIEKAAPAEALILSSTSGLTPSSMSARMADPGRLVVGHPFNPPHLIPLVELVGASEREVARAKEFYLSLGKVPVVVHKEVRGHVANRLQRVLFEECVNLVEQGVVSMTELDDIVTNSVGVRWATVGPFLAFHLGGGPGGLRHMMSHLMPYVPAEVQERLADQAEAVYPLASNEERAARRDRQQLEIISSKERDDDVR
ncbi:3-hydroxyacyl-CoA dehydrogenase NAD-binding domain-containing protein [Kutzneria buriramensis]|uniref:Ketoreductase RED1 n=1 Tax=Kutzneria buriramensis TaxID=1045776 RepID=A0A3E0HFW2_9PSEU|nr:3-hydroxyacyl-CoA dehydrogenase NAD-binding domain-containing protein [Kutzneria buriramensis]REH44692.1 ketoreductase RED1 [Kutzneria buriramensis]